MESSRRPQAAGRRPQAAGRRPQAAGRRPQAADRRPQAADRRPQAAGTQLARPQSQRVAHPAAASGVCWLARAAGRPRASLQAIWTSAQGAGPGLNTSGCQQGNIWRRCFISPAHHVVSLPLQCTSLFLFSVWLVFNQTQDGTAPSGGSGRLQDCSDQSIPREDFATYHHT